MSRRRVPTILGPTAVGKSAVAFRLAQVLGGEIVVADSRQLYRRLEIATNKPSPEERAAVRYHCLDLVDPEDSFNVFEFVRAATDALHRSERPILEGGTNLYVDALLDGLSLGGVPPSPERRRELERLPVQELAGMVRELDPEIAIDFRNPVRLVRAIEVLEVTGPPWSRLRTHRPTAWDGIRIGLDLPREVLDERILARCRRQLERGLVEETRAALEAGVAPGSQALTGTGYAETVAYLQGKVSEQQLPELMARNNRRLARRQLTWLKRDSRIRWFSAVADPLPDILRYLDG